MNRQFREPASVAAALERGVPLPDGPGHRYTGYSVLGVTFKSGDLLALRRFPVTSTGIGYTCVWHRATNGRWTFYADVPADQGCAPYFAPEIRETILAPIRLEWIGARSLEVAVDGGRQLAWSLALAPTLATRLLNAAALVLPTACWSDERALVVLAGIARGVLRAGRLRLCGTTPSGSRFLSNPRIVWAVVASRATIVGHDLGPLGSISPQSALGDFWIPRRPLFAVASEFMVVNDASGARTCEPGSPGG